jgi:DNA-binding GntR family transcriptional regulator
MIRVREIGAVPEQAQDAVYRWLKQHVLSLPGHQGQFLTETEVCRATGTSRTPVREALLRLEADGLLEILPKKGAYVPPIGDVEVDAVMEARGLVEDWCVRRAADPRLSPVSDLERLLDEQRMLVEAPTPFIECDREFHRTIVRAAGNAVLATFYESLRDRQLRMGLHAIVAAKDRKESVLAEHAAIVDALREGDSERAAEAMATHLANTLAVLKRPASSNFGRRA